MRTRADEAEKEVNLCEAKNNENIIALSLIY